MKILNTLLLALLLACPHVALASPEAERKAMAGELLDSLGMERTLQEALAMMMDIQLKSHPQLEPYREILGDFMGRHMSYAALRDELVDIYAAEFTLGELRAARDFYASAEGQRFVALQPQLMQAGGELGQRRVTENAAELEAAIAAEKLRLDAEAAASGKSEATLEK